MNKMLLKLISLFLLMQFMESECQNYTYDLSAQYEEFAKQGALKQLFKAQIRNQEIMGFICACALIREANNQEYKKARQIFADYMCATTWKLYFEHLRKVESGKSYFLEFLQPKEHDASCALALCASFDVCSKHIRCDSNTVQILTQLRIGTTKSIEEMLQKESPRYLLSVEDMNLINGFLKAVGQAPFRFIKLIKFGKEYAIPKVRNYTDRLVCPSYFRHPSSV